MAYTTIDDPTIYFNTKLWTGNGSASTGQTGVGFQPDWVWIKARTGTQGSQSHVLFDSVRGAGKYLFSDSNDEENTDTNRLTSFDSDGFTVGSNNSVNASSTTYVAWNWLAGGTAPAITYSVKVVSDSGNKYRFDDFGTSAVTLDLQEGGTYTFDQSDSSNSGHPLRFSTTSDGTHGGGSEYTTNVTTTGTPGSAGAKTVITVAASAPTLYYYCTQHSGMGGQANTNSTFGSSNFSGSIQTNVSANTTAGFSIATFTSAGATTCNIGHGLGVKPSFVIIKNRSDTNQWIIYHHKLNIGTSAPPENVGIALEVTSAGFDYPVFQDTAPTSTLMYYGYSADVGCSSDANGENFVVYSFAEKKGYSKFGSFVGNGSTDGAFVYTGFKPAWILLKAGNNGSWDWRLSDSTRTTFNSSTHHNLFPSSSNAEVTNEKDIDYLSNGFKLRTSGSGVNASGYEMIYMAFSESPFVNSSGVPTNAR